MQIATLPVNDNQDQDNTNNVNTKDNLLNVVLYSAKSFIVFGDATKTYKDSLKALGGKYNGRLGVRDGFPGGPAWIFPIHLREKVVEFVTKVNSKSVDLPDPNQMDTVGLPTVIAPIQNKKYQTVRWKVFLPVTGMSVSIKANGTQVMGEVIQTETHNDIVDTAYITINGNTSKLVICNGSWQVAGYMAEHTVFFKTSDQTETVESPQYDHDDTDPYRDIANI